MSVRSALNLAGAKLRFGDEELLTEKLGVTRGSVSPLSLVNDAGREVRFCVDKALRPLRNDRTASLAPAELLRFLKHIEHDPTVIDFDAVATAAASAPAAGANPPVV